MGCLARDRRREPLPRRLQVQVGRLLPEKLHELQQQFLRLVAHVLIHRLIDGAHLRRRGRVLEGAAQFAEPAQRRRQPAQQIGQWRPRPSRLRSGDARSRTRSRIAAALSRTWTRTTFASTRSSYRRRIWSHCPDWSADSSWRCTRVSGLSAFAASLTSSQGKLGRLETRVRAQILEELIQRAGGGIHAELIREGK